MTALYIRIANWLRDQEGATAVEYGLLVALVGVIIMTTALALGTQISAVFTSVTEAITP